MKLLRTELGWLTTGVILILLNAVHQPILEILGHGDVVGAVTVAVAVPILGWWGISSIRYRFGTETIPLRRQSLRLLGGFEWVIAAVLALAFLVSNGSVGAPEAAIVGTLFIAGSLLIVAGTDSPVGRQHWRRLTASSYAVLGSGCIVLVGGLFVTASGAALLRISVVGFGGLFLMIALQIAVDSDRITVQTQPDRASPLDLKQ